MSQLSALGETERRELRFYSFRNVYLFGQPSIVQRDIGLSIAISNCFRIRFKWISFDKIRSRFLLLVVCWNYFTFLVLTLFPSVPMYTVVYIKLEASHR